MSRAVNIDATREQVIAMSAKHHAEISAIEPLHPSGTRVVFMNSRDAAAMAKAYRSRLVKGPVTRTRLRP